ncbi:hypothetical protein LXL04_012818 [Taraxacum kok-saghyz]
MTGPEKVGASEKPYGITNIKSYVPLILDYDHMNYDSWRELFETHCKGFGVSKHLLPPPAIAPASEEWDEIDSIVKAWIYGTITQSLLQQIIKKNSTAYDVWTAIEKLFRDNQDSRAVELDNELRSITMGDSTVTDYFNRIKRISDLLDNIGHTYASVATFIRHQKPFPSLSDVRSMITIEEQRVKSDESKALAGVHNDHSSSPTALSTTIVVVRFLDNNNHGGCSTST